MFLTRDVARLVWSPRFLHPLIVNANDIGHWKRAVIIVYSLLQVMQIILVVEALSNETVYNELGCAPFVVISFGFLNKPL